MVPPPRVALAPHPTPTSATPHPTFTHQPAPCHSPNPPPTLPPPTPLQVPLGVLKAGAIEFSPPLPPWKKEAIARLGFGDLNKVGGPGARTTLTVNVSERD